ncbi:MAG: adenylate/guanylate cyclase domain-containing protein [Halobacteriovoraceae bacterium]|nr:adenylate/guanylate cyclase domain-containing protein [Halobacteriovoraceae bacterium]
MKFFSRFLSSIGVFVIISVSVFAIIVDVLVRDLPDDDIFKQTFNFIGSFESRFYDYRMKDHIKNYPKNDNVRLIEIDDKSLQVINSWPIPRENWAKVLDNLKDFGAKVVVFDVLFPEPVKACNEESPDKVLAKSLLNFQGEEEETGQSVVFAYSVQESPLNEQDEIFFNNSDPLMYLYTSLFSQTKSSKCDFMQHRRIEKHTWPIEIYLDANPQLGYLNMEEDSDGVFRHYSVFADTSDGEGGYMQLPSLGLRAFLSSTNYKDVSLQIGADCLGYFKVNKQELVTSSSSETKLRWVGGRDKFESISLYRVIAGKDFEEKVNIYDEDENLKTITKKINIKKFFKDKVVFIGSTAIGAHDLRNTPIDSKLPGVYAHMNFVNMMQTQFFYKPIEKSIEYSIVLIAICMLILILTMLLNKAILDLFVLLILVGATYYIDSIYFIEFGYQLKLFYCYFAFIATYSWVTFLNFNQANAEKKQIKGAFSRYVAPSIVDDMLDNPDKLKVGGEKLDITCMFSDVRDFTTISETLSPTDLAMALNRYMGEMTDIIFDTNGTLDKYIGDAIVAFWGAPLDIGDHVNQAVHAAVLQLEALPAINEEFKQKGFPEFKIGLGLNSGECSVGNMGSDQIFAYTALGDTMNLGARLESLCKYYGAQILGSQYTYARMDQERFPTRLIDNVVVKGKTEPVGVYEVMYSYHAFMINLDDLAKFKEAFNLFLEAKFQEAKVIFDDLAIRHPNDKASNRMKDTCDHWIENPPKEGEDYRVTTMTTKG